MTNKKFHETYGEFDLNFVNNCDQLVQFSQEVSRLGNKERAIEILECDLYGYMFEVYKLDTLIRDHFIEQAKKTPDVKEKEAYMRMAKCFSKIVENKRTQISELEKTVVELKEIMAQGKSEEDKEEK